MLKHGVRKLLSNQRIFTPARIAITLNAIVLLIAIAGRVALLAYFMNMEQFNIRADLEDTVQGMFVIALYCLPFALSIIAFTTKPKSFLLIIVLLLNIAIMFLFIFLLTQYGAVSGWVYGGFMTTVVLITGYNCVVAKKIGIENFSQPLNKE